MKNQCAIVCFIVALGGFATHVEAIAAPAALQFIPVTPCRIADTRNPTGAFGGPELARESTRTFVIPQSACSIPTTAVAYSLNVTVVPNASLNYLTMWPAGETQPNVSTLNSDGRVKANAAIIPAGTSGGVSLYASDATQAILDIDGYFVPAGTTSALAFYPVTPCRIADTRNASGPEGGPSLAGNSSRAFPIQNICNIPSSAQAYSLNITAVPNGGLNYLTTWPTGETQPLVSTLNSSTGAVAANAAIVPAGTSGDISVFVSNPANVILDVNGYFAAPASSGLSLYTVTPCRVIDTRSGSGAFTGTLAVGVETSPCAPPSTAQSYVLNATVVPASDLNYLSLWPAGESQPGVSTLNALDGAITSNMAIVPTTNGSIDAYASSSTNLILDIASYFAPYVAPVSVTTTSLVAGSVSSAYSQTLTATGGVLPYTWSISSGSLPAGLSLTAGVISGTPTATGTSSFTVEVTDSASSTATASLSILIYPTLTLPAYNSLPVGDVGVAYSGSIAPSGGSGNFCWTVPTAQQRASSGMPGGLPDGLALPSPNSSGTGCNYFGNALAISGTPTNPPTPPYTVVFGATVTDTSTGTSAGRTYSITINGPIAFTTSSLPAATAGTPYQSSISVSGGVAPYTFSVTSGAIPSWLTASPLSPTASASGSLTLSGSPAATNQGGPFTFTVTATDSTGVHVSHQFSITVGSTAAPVCSHDGSANALLNGHYAFQLAGYDPKGNKYASIGDFTANGSGVILNGVGDVNSSGFATVGEQQYAFSGTYSIGDSANDDRGITTWSNTNTTATGLPATATYCFSADTVTSGVAYSGHMIEADGSGYVLTGFFEIQNPSYFTEESLNHGYVFSLQGHNTSDGFSGIFRSGLVGRVVLNGTGGVTGGAFDVAQYDPSTVSQTYQSGVAITSAGSSLSIASNGRGTLTINSAAGAGTFVVYVVGDANSLIMMSSGNINSSTLWNGLARQQTTTSFTSANIAASSVVSRDATTDPTRSPIFDNVMVGQIVFGSDGNVTTLGDSNAGGVIQGPSTGSGTYTFTSSGYLTLTQSGGVRNFYLYAPGGGFGLNTSSTATDVPVVSLEPQTIPTGGFTTADIAGSYAVGTLSPEAYNYNNPVGDVYPTVLEGTSTIASGTATLALDYVGAPGLGSDIAVDQSSTDTDALDSTYGASAGRVVFQQDGSTAVIGYIVSSSEVLLIQAQPGNDGLIVQANRQQAETPAVTLRGPEIGSGIRPTSGLRNFESKTE